MEVRLMRLSRLTFTAVLLTLAGIIAAPSAVAIDVSYLFNLSDFNGTVPYDDVRLHVDRSRDELYAAVGNEVRIFNPSGMESYRFELDATLGRIFGLAVDDKGDILLLSLDLSDRSRLPDWYIIRCNYRGEPIGRMRVTGLPPEYDGFVPNLMLHRGDRLVLVSRAQLMVAVVDRDGLFETGYDLAELLDIDDEKRGDHDLQGFDVDQQGNLIFTIPVFFKAFVVSPDGNVKAFGRPGSIPGSFGIVADIVVDDQGNLIVADKLRRVVMVFDRNYQFLTEFGAGETGRVWLQRPSHLALGNDGKVYVTQTGKKGVAVYKLSTGGEVIRLDSGPQTRGGDVRGGELSIEPGQSATERVSVAGQSTRPPEQPSDGGSFRIAGPADRRTTGTPETQGGEQQ